MASVVANGNANGTANGHYAKEPHKRKLADTAAVECLEHYSELQRNRLDYVPPKPDVLHGAYTVKTQQATYQEAVDARLKQHFPHTFGRPPVFLEKRSHADSAAANGAASTPLPSHLNIGIVLSGGQAPGGHNIIAGLLDFLCQRVPGSQLFGFLNGPRGIVTGQATEITVEAMLAYRNQGGFHMVGSGRDKIESAADLAAAAGTCQAMDLDGLVVCGGDDSNTNAAVLAEYFAGQGLKTRVVGVPKTIDGDLKNADVATSFGFDTAAKVYSELIGNIAIDALSAKKYYHFIRLMGRAASHITLEAALQTHPQAALISEEVAELRLGLRDVANQVADMIAARAAKGKNYGIILIPEGLIEFVHEVRDLILELNELLAGSNDGGPEPAPEAVAAQLSPASREVYDLLPPAQRLELLLERDPHGNVQVARIETEKLLLRLVEAELAARRQAGTFKGKFAGLPHYFGYEGRCSLPSNFDATYCYSLGYAAGAMIGAGQTGIMATIARLERPTKEWRVGGTPLVSMMCVERRKGKDKPVVRKALVDLNGPAFAAFKEARDTWAINDCYRSPGPIQFAGAESAKANMTLALEINGGEDISLH